MRDSFKGDKNSINLLSSQLLRTTALSNVYLLKIQLTFYVLTFMIMTLLEPISFTTEYAFINVSC